MRHLNLLGLVCLAGALASLAGCAGKIRYPSYYVLNIPAPAPAARDPKPALGSVAVREFAAPRFLWAGPIVYRQSAEELGFYHYDRWAVDPRNSVTNAVVQDMQARGVFQSVRVYDGRESSDYLVTGTLTHLEEVDHGHDVFIDVRLSAQLLDSKTGDLLWSDASSETTKLDHSGVQGVVAEMSQATDRAVERLVSSMQNRLISISPPSGRTASGQ